MTLYEKLEKSVNFYRHNSNIQDLFNVLFEIKQKPRSLASDLKENLAILVKILCHKDSVTNIKEVSKLKDSILDVFILSIEFSDFAWYLIEHIGLLSILFDEFYNENDISLKSKMLQCIEIYLLFEEFESKIYTPCEKFCCNLGIKRVLDEIKIFEFCQAIIQSINSLIESSESTVAIESHLITLSMVVRRFSVNLSPELCGDIETYKQFNQFLLTVCKSERYSSISAISALACFYHASDPNSSKCFTVKNAGFTTNIIYNALSQPESTNRIPKCVYAVILLNDVLKNQTILQFIRKQWKEDNYKSICKLLISEYPVNHYDKILDLFMTIKSVIPEWNAIIERYVMTNSKFLKFLIVLSCKPAHNAAILSWQLLNLYFQPGEIPREFISDYCTLIVNSVKINLEMAFYPDKKSLEENPNFLLNRNHMKSVTRALSALDMLLTMTDFDDLSLPLANMSAKIHLMTFFESLIKNLLDETNDIVLFVKIASSSPSEIGTLCESNHWIISGTRLIVSLLFYGISMSARFPSIICKKNLNTFLMKPLFMKILVACLTQSNNGIYVERSMALITVSSQFPEYDLTKLSEMVFETMKQFNKNCQYHSKTNNTSMVMTSNEETSLKYQLSVRKLVDSLINDENKKMSESEISTILIEEIKSLRDHQNLLEDIIKKKDSYILHCHNLANEYRDKMLGNDNRFQKIVSKLADIQNSAEIQAGVIVKQTDQLTQYEKSLNDREHLLASKQIEIDKCQIDLTDMKSKYMKEVEKVTQSELVVDDLHSRLAKTEEELKSKTKDIQRLENVNKIIHDLIGNKISPESFSSGGDGS